MTDRKNENDRNKMFGRKTVLPAAAAAAVLLCAVMAVSVSGKKKDETPSAEPADKAAAVIAPGESLVIPISEITEEAVFYPLKVDGEDMEVFAVKASDGTIRTAFNTCQSCYTSGAGFYRFEEGELICSNCGAHFSPDQVEATTGGCNPWPIPDENKTVTDDSISISYDFLSESKEIFANWKTA